MSSNNPLDFKVVVDSNQVPRSREEAIELVQTTASNAANSLQSLASRVADPSLTAASSSTTLGNLATPSVTAAAARIADPHILRRNNSPDFYDADDRYYLAEEVPGGASNRLSQNFSNLADFASASRAVQDEMEAARYEAEGEDDEAYGFRPKNGPDSAPEAELGFVGLRKSRDGAAGSPASVTMFAEATAEDQGKRRRKRMGMRKRRNGTTSSDGGMSDAQKKLAQSGKAINRGLGKAGNLVGEGFKKTGGMLGSVGEDFSNFLRQGNVVDLAVGLVLGAAITNLINSIVTDLVAPIIGLAIEANLQNAFIVLKCSGNATNADCKVGSQSGYGTVVQANGDGAVTFNWGNFIQVCINVTIIAMVVFFVVKVYSSTFLRKYGGGKKKPCPRCDEEVSVNALVCKWCANEFEPPAPSPPPSKSMKFPLSLRPKKKDSNSALASPKEEEPPKLDGDEIVPVGNESKKGAGGFPA
ncbi:hypothetical protein HDU96_006463 [Phlyctochytrium bullatum]|nr:hypothetical protein HDU96_006463 [Phlyctochytrium bullatum]